MRNEGRFKPKFAPVEEGQTYGLWLVLSKGEHKYNQQRWLCRCQCGIEKEIASQHLAGGKSTRCIKCSGRKNSERARSRNVMEDGTVYFASGNRITWIREARKEKHKHQNGVCPICLRPVSVNDCLDHDHKTGISRDLIHRGCNVFIGFLENHPGIIERSTNYLERHSRNA